MLVALTRELGHNEDLRRLVGDLAEVVEVPLTRTHYRDLADVGSELAALAGGPYATLVVTSARAVRYVPLALEVATDHVDLLSVGPATTRALAEAGLGVAAQSAGTALDLVDVVAEYPVLILAALGGREELAEALASRGVACDVVACYETVGVELDAAQGASLRGADVVFIGAPSAWRVARPYVRPDAWVLVPGPTTRDEVAAEHGRVTLGWGDDFPAAWDEVSSGR